MNRAADAAAEPRGRGEDRRRARHQSKQSGPRPAPADDGAPALHPGKQAAERVRPGRRRQQQPDGGERERHPRPDHDWPAIVGLDNQVADHHRTEQPGQGKPPAGRDEPAPAACEQRGERDGEQAGRDPVGRQPRSAGTEQQQGPGGKPADRGSRLRQPGFTE